MQIDQIRQDWIGRECVTTGYLTPELVERFAATLELPLGDALPLGIHWCVGLDSIATGALGADGHPPKGNFLPPITYPRRMWASGEVEVLAPLRVGQVLERLSRIENIVEKSGASGGLCFVTLRHSIRADGRPVIEERQDIVYREPSGAFADLPADAPGPLPEDAQRLLPSSVLLFRYSALTFNAHRIHYDLPYARNEENYPSLVVHGPLQATLLAAHAEQKLGRPLRRFAFRGRAPAFAGATLDLRARSEGEGLSVWSEQFSQTCMTGEAL